MTTHGRSERPRSRRSPVVIGVGALALLAAALLLNLRQAEDAAAAATARAPTPQEDVWFRGDFETGDLRGWHGDLARPESAQVVTEPVRRGRHAVRITLAPGDRAAQKERAELRLGDRGLERVHAGEGKTVWSGWSLLVPEDHADPPGGQYPILAQWHHRPDRPSGGAGPAHVTGPPPLALYLVSDAGRQSLVLIAQEGPTAPPKRLAERAIRRGQWIDLVFQTRWSTGDDGLVAAWIDGEPFTDGARHGPTLYNPLGNYLRLGFYRGKGGTTTNRVYYDEVWMAGAPPPGLAR